MSLTPNLSLYKPAVGEIGWGDAVDGNFDTIDTFSATVIPKTSIDTDGTLAGNSDTKVASQKATKTYVDAQIPAKSTNQYYSTQYTTTVTLDWNNGNVQYIVLANGGQTFTFANGKAGGRYLLILKQPPSSSAGTVTWPNTVLWPSGTPPTLTVTNGKVDIVTFVYDGTNSKYYGGVSLNY